MTPAEQIRADLAARQADIRGRRDLSDEGRTRQLARATADAKKKMKALREKETASIEKRRADLVQRLFGNAKSWDTTATILYRDSQDRAAKLKTPDEATEMMERALMSGDASLARAIAMRATQQALVPMVGDKWAPVVDKWAQSQPDNVGEDIGELADIVQATTKPQHQFARNMSYSVPTPGELSGKDINRLAMDADENPGENEPDLSTGFENPRRRMTREQIFGTHSTPEAS
jgi:hypothetical protein